MFKGGRSSRLVSVVGGCLAALTLGAAGLGKKDQEVWAADAPVPQELKPAARFGADEPQLRWAPYVWKRFGSGATARAEATMPGASMPWARTTSG
jgi:hypothetical protein